MNLPYHRGLYSLHTVITTDNSTNNSAFYNHFSKQFSYRSHREQRKWWLWKVHLLQKAAKSEGDQRRVQVGGAMAGTIPFGHKFTPFKPVIAAVQQVIMERWLMSLDCGHHSHHRQGVVDWMGVTEEMGIANCCAALLLLTATYNTKRRWENKYSHHPRVLCSSDKIAQFAIS